MTAARNERAARLARQVRMRLAELGLPARGLVRAGYIPRGNIERLIAGESVPRSLIGLDRGLGWRPGSAARAADGGDPTPVLRLPGQGLESGFETYVAWPREDGDWRAACEAAWAALEHQQQAGTLKELPSEPSSPEQATDAVTSPPATDQEWLERRIGDWPAWLADRTRRILAEAETDEDGDLLALADRIMGLDHARDLLRLLLAWNDGRTPDAN